MSMSFKREKLPDMEKTDVKKIKQKNNDKVKQCDPNKFDDAGLNFKAKLIGNESVMDKKGDRMCQVSMAKLKAGAVALGEHKAKVVINLSYAGVSIYDDKQEKLLSRHLVPQISFVSRDTNDSRAFGYVLSSKGDENDPAKYIYWAFKTEKAADPLMLCLKELFTITSGGIGTVDTGITDEAAEATQQQSVAGDVTTAADQLDGKAATSYQENKDLIANVEATPQRLINVEQDILGLNLSSNHPQQLKQAPQQLKQAPQPLQRPPQQPSSLLPQPQQQPQQMQQQLHQLQQIPQHQQQPMIGTPPYSYTSPTTTSVPHAYPYMASPYPQTGTSQPGQFLAYNQMQAHMFNPFQPPQMYHPSFQHPQQNQLMQQFPQLQQQQHQQLQRQQSLQQQQQRPLGWTTFDQQQQQQQLHQQPTNPFSSPPVPHNNLNSTLRSTASQPDFTVNHLENDLEDDFIENLTNITKSPAYPNGKLVTKQDFYKESSNKPTLFALVGMKNNPTQPHPQNNSITSPPPPCSKPRNDSISLDVNSDKSSSGSEHSRSVIEEAGKVLEDSQIRPRPSGIGDKSFAQVVLNKQVSHRPMHIDLQAMRYSPLEDKKGLSESTLVDWEGSPSNKPVFLDTSNWNYKK